MSRAKFRWNGRRARVLSVNTRHLWTVILWLLAVVPVAWLVGEESTRSVPEWVKVATVTYNAIIAFTGSTYLACEIVESKEDRAC